MKYNPSYLVLKSPYLSFCQYMFLFHRNAVGTGPVIQSYQRMHLQRLFMYIAIG